jgi:ATP-dependent Lon protease
MEQVLRHALVRMPDPIEWDASMNSEKVPAVVDEEGSGLVAH